MIIINWYLIIQKVHKRTQQKYIPKRVSKTRDTNGTYKHLIQKGTHTHTQLMALYISSQERKINSERKGII